MNILGFTFSFFDFFHMNKLYFKYIVYINHIIYKNLSFNLEFYITKLQKIFLTFASHKTHVAQSS